ncbi:MAG: hypothetical protein U9N01_04360 [Euryarchaeota archaeon]|nr:hypothetical protein [Euryarchaeota archaeon]
MSDDLDATPSGEDEKKDLITDAMVRKATYLIHKLADRRGADYKEIQKKCKKSLGYENLAKVSMEEGHRIIDKLVELTGGEETNGLSAPQKPQLPTKPDNGFTPRQAAESEGDELLSEIGKLAEMLQICVGYSRDIVKEEIGKENVSEGTQAMLTKSFAATLFIEASRRGLGK